MPDIILKINDIDDVIYEADGICCYVGETSLPDAVFEKLKATGKMVLASGGQAVEKALALKLDGIVIKTDSAKPLKAQIRPQRDRMGAKKALGVIVAPSRHEAMLAAETEPEFVAFACAPENLEKVRETVDWYNEFFLIQSALAPEGKIAADKLPAADFVILNSAEYKDFSC